MLRGDNGRGRWTSHRTSLFFCYHRWMLPKDQDASSSHFMQRSTEVLSVCRFDKIKISLASPWLVAMFLLVCVSTKLYNISHAIVIPEAALTCKAASLQPNAIWFLGKKKTEILSDIHDCNFARKCNALQSISMRRMQIFWDVPCVLFSPLACLLLFCRSGSLEHVMWCHANKTGYSQLLLHPRNNEFHIRMCPRDTDQFNSMAPMASTNGILVYRLCCFASDAISQLPPCLSAALHFTSRQTITWFDPVK